MTKDHKNQYGSWLKSQRASNLFRFLGGLGPKCPLLTARSAERQGRFKHHRQRMNNPDNPVIKSGGTITFTPSKKLTSNLEVNFISKNPGGKKNIKKSGGFLLTSPPNTSPWAAIPCGGPNRGPRARRKWRAVQVFCNKMWGKHRENLHFTRWTANFLTEVQVF